MEPGTCFVLGRDATARAYGCVSLKIVNVLAVGFRASSISSFRRNGHHCQVVAVRESALGVALRLQLPDRWGLGST